MTEKKSRPLDRLYAEKLDTVKDFAFDDAVTHVFDDMVRRSVPGYETVVDLISIIGEAHASQIKRPLQCMDLGCSRGAVTSALLQRLDDPATQVTAVDNSPHMIKAARSEITDPRVKFIVDDVLNAPMKDIDVIVLNLVLQFIDPDKRLDLLTRIRNGLRRDGMLILTEKIESTPAFADYHLVFKRAKGYSNLEINQKRDALEKVMLIDSLQTHQLRLRNAGFTRVTVWFQLLNWVSLLARP